nr:hypothetical protein [Tanacetum cinerariifolium]
MTRSSTKELTEPYNEPGQVLHSLRKLFKTTSFDHSSSPKFKLFSDYEEHVEEEITETMTEPTMEEYMTKTREDYGSGIARLKFKPKGQFLKELHDNTFSGSENEDANEHIERVLEIMVKERTYWEIKKVNEKVYAAQVGCKLCDGPHYSKDFSLKEEGKTLEEAYYTQFGVPFPNAERYKAVVPGFYQIDNENPSYQKRRQTMEESLSKFMTKYAKRHDEKSFLIKEIRASTDAAIRNQRASIKALEIQTKRIRYFPRLRQDKDHYLTLKNTSYPVQQIRQYVTREDYGSGIARLKFEPKGQFLKELRDNTFSGSENDDANEHTKRVLEIVDLSTTLVVTRDQLMLRVFPISLTGAASRWLRNEPTAAIQAQLNNLGREIKKVNEIVYAAQVGCKLCNGPYYSKDFSLKEEGKTLEEAYYTQFGVQFPNAGRYRAAAPRFYRIDNGNPPYQERRQTMENH